MKKSIVIRALVALWLSFMIATVGPALFGDMLALTAPLTCPGGHIDVQTDVYHPRPGETDVTRTPLCTSAGGTTSEVPTLAAMAAIWGMAFLPSLLLAFLIPYKYVAFADETIPTVPDVQPSSPVGSAGRVNTAASRLKELEEAHQQQLITREEYEAKRAEIIKEM